MAVDNPFLNRFNNHFYVLNQFEVHNNTCVYSTST
jgi:hypothetical protein